MNKIRIEIYETKNGRKPYSDWLMKLDSSIRSVIRTRIDRVLLGNFGDCHPIKGHKGIGELILDFGPGYRIYYGKVNDAVIVLLIGGIKKSQIRDIEKAHEYWCDYKENSI